MLGISEHMAFFVVLCLFGRAVWLEEFAIFVCFVLVRAKSIWVGSGVWGYIRGFRNLSGMQGNAPGLYRSVGKVLSEWVDEYRLPTDRNLCWLET